MPGLHPQPDREGAAIGIDDDTLNALIDVVSAVNAGVSAATAREGFRMADADAANEPCGDLCDGGGIRPGRGPDLVTGAGPGRSRSPAEAAPMSKPEPRANRHQLCVWLKWAIESGLLGKVPPRYDPDGSGEPEPTEDYARRLLAELKTRIPAGDYSARSSPTPVGSGTGSSTATRSAAG